MKMMKLKFIKPNYLKKIIQLWIRVSKYILMFSFRCFNILCAYLNVMLLFF